MLVVKAALLMALSYGVLAENGEVESGIEFIKTGKLNIATGSWNLLVDLDLHPLKGQVRELRKICQAVDHAVKDIVSYEEDMMNMDNSVNASQKNGSRIGSELMLTWAPELRIFQHEIDGMERELNAMPQMGPMRRRRSLMPVVGSGLGYLFGVATKGDVEKLQNLVNNSAERSKEIMHLQEKQLTLFKTLSREQKKQNRVLEVLGKHTVAIQNELQQISARLADLPRFVMIINKLTSLSRVLHANLGSFRHELSRVQRLVTNLAKGSLTSGLLSNNDIIRVLEEIQKTLPRGWRLAVPPKQNTWAYYESLAVSAIPTLKGWRVFIPIPIQLQDVPTLELFTGLSFPLVNPTTNASIMTELPRKYFALSPDRRLHVALHSHDLESCIIFGDTYVCPNIATIRGDIDNCMWNAFHQELKGIDTFCKRRILTGKPVPQHLYGGKWVYAFWNETRVEMKCPHMMQGKELLTLSGNGILSVPDGCWVIGESFTLLGSLHGIKKVQPSFPVKNDRFAEEEMLTNRLINVTRWADSLLKSKHAEILRMNRADIDDLLEADKDVDVALEDLKKTWTIVQARKLKNPTFSDTAVDVSRWSLSSIGLLVALLIIVHKCCKGEKQNTTNTVPSLIMQTHAAGCSAKENDSKPLEKQVVEQKEEIQRLWQELSKMKKYQL